ncbi:MAG: 3-keto-disaccharide hydrolase [Aureliella sp.]
MMRSQAFFAFQALVAIGIVALASNRSHAQEAVPLFNGRDLSGWVFVNTTPRTWQVEDGILKCTGKPIGEIRTEQMYQNFELELEWRHMVPGGNAGVFVWADDITSRGVPFHRGIEVQVLENAYGNDRSHTTHGDIFPIHGATMTPINGRGGSRAFPTENRAKSSPEWNHYRIVCNDGNISLAVNGKVVTQGKDASPRKGYICLESEGGVAHYRNIHIKELPDTPVDPKDVAIANRGYRSVYTGLDLSGWKVGDSASSSWHVKDWVLAFDGKVPAEQSQLELDQPLDLTGFVIDFRFVEQSDSLTIDLPGDSQPLVIRAQDDQGFGKMLEKTGRWNRLEGSIQDGKLRLSLNGQSTEVEHTAATGSLAIRVNGPIELSNLYVREK